MLLPRPTLDHFPILLDYGGLRRGKSPFRYEKMWLKGEGFYDWVRKWCQSYVFMDSYNFVLVSKSKALKEDLKKWNNRSLAMFQFEKRWH